MAKFFQTKIINLKLANYYCRLKDSYEASTKCNEQNKTEKALTG